MEMFTWFSGVTLAAAGGASVVAAGASDLSRWVRRAGAILAGVAVMFAARAGIETSIGIGMLVVMTAGLIGAVFATTIQDLDSLILLALAAAAADIVSFLFGPTRFLLENGPGAGGYARYLAVGLDTAEGLMLVVGFGDLVFVAVFTMALRHLGARPLAAFLAPFSGLLVALAVGLAVGGTVGIPLAATTTILYARLRLRPAQSSAGAKPVRSDRVTRQG